MAETFHIADLVVKKIRGTITPGEQQELEYWISEDPENQAVYNRAVDPKLQLKKLEIYRLFDKEKVRANLEEELFGTKIVKFEARKLLRYAAAILLPLIVGGGFAWWYLRAPSVDTLAEIDAVIQPGTQKAILILSDGKAVELGQGESLATLVDGDASITDEDQGISYHSESRDKQLRKMVFNELQTPRGGGYRLQLTDGSKVWLNAGSSIRYPVAFHDSIRQVFLDGEAYFEVSHNEKPFVVNSGNMHTKVLGTSFNISAYSDDGTFKTTLVEGKVKVELLGDDLSLSASTTLAPNEQATFLQASRELITSQVDASGYVSWMRGKMEFHNEDLESVMSRLARWYDFEYLFENEEARRFHFSARLDKEESISVILEMLEMTTDVKFEYQENRIVVF